MEAREHISILVHMSLNKPEDLHKRREYLYAIGRSKDLTDNEVDYLIEFPDSVPNLETLTEEDTFECLYTCVQFMKYNKKIRRKEVKYCEEIAIRLGYSPQVILELSAFIYSDPSLSVNPEFLKKLTIVYSMHQQSSRIRKSAG